MRLSQRLAPLQGVLQQKKPPETVFQFTGWTPDLPALGNSGEITANGVVPVVGGYGPLGSLTKTYTTAGSGFSSGFSSGFGGGGLGQRCSGAISLRDAANVTYTYAGDAGTIVEITSAGPTDESGATYTTASDDAWEFTQFGDNVLATNFADPVQGLSIG